MHPVFHFIRSFVKRGDSTLVAKKRIGTHNNRILKTADVSLYSFPKRMGIIREEMEKNRTNINSPNVNISPLPP